MKITKSEILAPSIEVVLGLVTFEEFIKKFARMSYNIHKNGTPEAIEEAGFIESLWGPCCAGMISKDDFIVMLGSRVNFTQTDTYAFAYTVSDESI